MLILKKSYSGAGSIWHKVIYIWFSGSLCRPLKLLDGFLPQFSALKGNISLCIFTARKGIIQLAWVLSPHHSPPPFPTVTFATFLPKELFGRGLALPVSFTLVYSKESRLLFPIVSKSYEFHSKWCRGRRLSKCHCGFHRVYAAKNHLNGWTTQKKSSCHPHRSW